MPKVCTPTVCFMFDCSVEVIEPRMLESLRTYPEWHYCCFAFRNAIDRIEMAIYVPIVLIDWSQRSLLKLEFYVNASGEERHVIT